MDVFVELLVLLVLTRLFGEAAEHMGQAASIGERAAGIFVAALGGMVLPLALGFGLAWLFLPESGLKQGQALMVGVAMSITWIPATVKIFEELGVIHAKVGELAVAAAPSSPPARRRRPGERGRIRGCG